MVFNLKTPNATPLCSWHRQTHFSLRNRWAWRHDHGNQRTQQCMVVMQSFRTGMRISLCITLQGSMLILMLKTQFKILFMVRGWRNFWSYSHRRKAVEEWDIPDTKWGTRKNQAPPANISHSHSCTVLPNKSHVQPHTIISYKLYKRRVWRMRRRWRKQRGSILRQQCLASGVRRRGVWGFSPQKNFGFFRLKNAWFLSFETPYPMYFHGWCYQSWSHNLIILSRLQCVHSYRHHLFKEGSW